MVATKIRIKVGAVEIDYEGPEAFLNKKLPDLISHLSRVAEQIPEGDGTAEGETRKKKGNKKVGTLAAFLRDTKVGKNATKRFLATAEWLHRKGSKELTTANVSTALRENHQTRLGNAAQCLNNNVNSGYCEKHGKSFYVTDDGRASLR